MYLTLAKGSLFPCQQSGCEYRVRLFKDLHLENVADFKCSKCLDLKGYSFCSECQGLCITNTIFCYICEEEYLNYKLPVDPKPEPTQKPISCTICNVNTDIKWTYNPFKIEIHDTYEYGWWCSQCLKKYYLEV